MGSGTEDRPHLAQPLGRLLARRGLNLLTGGGQGVMASVAKAFVEEPERKGASIGILPTIGADHRLPPGYPNQWIEIPVVAPLGAFDPLAPDAATRNWINVRTSDLIIALPGSDGTLNEIALALRMQKPLLLFGWADALPEVADRADSLAEVEEWLTKRLSDV